MNRRSFLATIAAGLALDPERALWVPGKKLISIPRPKRKLYMITDRRINKGFTSYSHIAIEDEKRLIGLLQSWNAVIGVTYSEVPRDADNEKLYALFQL